jgi:hypothetical protein
VIALLLMALGLGAQAPTVAAGVFHGCGLEGKADAARVKPLNVLKNRATAPATVDASITLERLMAPGDDRNRWSTDQAVTITGLVVEVKPGGIESVNCGATDAQWKDTHIGIVVDAKQADTPLIVEVTPRWRAAMHAAGVDWSSAALKRELFAHDVRITGWLFRDDEHLQNAINTNPHGTTLWRQTVWELHPVTAIEVLPSVNGAGMEKGESERLRALPAPLSLIAYADFVREGVVDGRRLELPTSALRTGRWPLDLFGAMRAFASLGNVAGTAIPP